MFQIHLTVVAILHACLKLCSTEIYFDSGETNINAAQFQKFYQEVGVADAYEEAAELLGASMDLTYQPCENFYQFACGRHREHVLAREPLHYWHNTWKGAQGKFTRKVIDLLDNLEPTATPLPELYTKLKIFYNTCTSRTEAKALQKSLIDIGMVIDDLGGTSLLDEFWRPKYQSVFVPMLQLVGLFGVQKLVKFYVDLDSQNPDRNVIYLQLDDSLGRYIAEWGVQAVKLYAKLREIPINDTWIDIQREEMYTFIDAVLNVTETVRNSGADTEKVKYLNLEALRNIDPNLADHLKWSFDANESTIIHTSEFDLTALIGLKPLWGNHERAVQNILVGTFMEFITVMLNLTDGDSQWERLAKNFGSDDQKLLKKQFCVLQIGHPDMRIFDFAVARLFVENYGPYEEDLLIVRKLFENVREKFKNMLFELPWLDFTSKNRALNKAGSTTPRFAYPPWLLNDTALGNYYKSYEGITSGDSFVRIWKNIFSAKFFAQVAQLKEPVTSTFDSFDSNTLGPNAFYHRLRNAMLVNLAFLQPPIYLEKYPPALIYAIVGSLLGHELTHGFDQKGIKYNRYGKAEKWMSDDSLQEFERNSECFIDQFSQFCFRVSGGRIMCVNGTTTVQENVADQGGLYASYGAYKAQQKLQENFESRRLPGKLGVLSWNQLFFLSYAVSWCEFQPIELFEKQLVNNKHPPNEARINGALQNFPPFAEAFNCPFGNSKMNPTCKCKVW